MAALIIENGTGVPNADSFITATTCSEIATAYFGSSLTHSPADKDAALRRAWVFMSALDWQPDLWPTFGGTIPQAVKTAQCVLARLEVTTPGFLSPNVALQGRKVLNKVGELGWDVRHGPDTVAAARPVVTMAFDLLKPYLANNPAEGPGLKFVSRA